MYNYKQLRIIHKITKHDQNSEFYVPELKGNLLSFTLWKQNSCTVIKGGYRNLGGAFSNSIRCIALKGVLKL